VLLVDLDRFKEVNDSLGHDAGDDLLKDIAAGLLQVAEDASVSRLGGDEFALVLGGTTPDQAVRLGHAVRRCIEAPHAIRGIPVSIDASIGIALAPDDGTDVGQLIRRADVAMYAAKRARAGVVRYEAESDLNDAGKLVLMTELRAAVEWGELEVHYQPIVAAESGVLRSVEALVRWRHPSKGLLMPAAFLPLAAHTRLVIDLNRYVLREAARQCAIWRRHGSDLGVAVNMTVLDLLRRSFASDVEATLRSVGLPPSALTIEITEDAFVQEPDRVLRTLDELRALGVRVAIDDFGTGYSSLSYLQRFSVDTLKIDRSFLASGGDGESWDIVETIITLAEDLGVNVIAEGVETEEQTERLKQLRCAHAQGYLFREPVDADAATALLVAQHKRRRSPTTPHT
jgi:diguanylate cyclase (GGDEF)-like protein